MEKFKKQCEIRTTVPHEVKEKANELSARYGMGIGELCRPCLVDFINQKHEQIFKPKPIIKK